MYQIPLMSNPIKTKLNKIYRLAEDIINYHKLVFKNFQEKENDCTSSVQNKNSEPHQIINFDEKANYLKKILEVENKCQYWMDKYDELYDKYLLLESKRFSVERENCSKKQRDR